mgnify:CR=1 FL=1
MALFDSIIGEAKEKFGLSGDNAGGLVAALLGLITDPTKGGFGGFIDRFRNAGLGDTVNSWITTGDNTPLTGNELESALGADTIDSVASQAGVDRGTAATAMAGMIPQVVDQLTPDGEVPDESTLLSRIGGFLSNWGGAVAGAAGAAGAFAAGTAGKVGGAVGDRGHGAMRSVGDAVDGDGSGSILKWLIPLVLLGLLIALGFWFCGRGTTPTGNTNANVNVNRTNANRVNTNANTNAAANTTAEAPRTLSEVTLANGTKLQAYPGGIEDQMVKFIQSAEYKSSTNDGLKDKWFNFDDLNFVTGKTELAPESKRQLDNIIAIMKAYPDVKIKIGGYTDKTGNDDANLKLSDSRAKAVQAALQKAGVGTQVPEAEGYGEKFATVEESASDEARKVDRKTAVRLIK